MEISALDKSIILLYFALMIGIGFALSTRIRTFDQFFLAGRGMSAPLLICTLVSTYYGLGVMLAGSEISYEAGVVNWFFDTSPAYLLILFTALFIAPKIRHRDFRSIPDIVDSHYGLTARVLSALASFVYALPAFSIMGMGGVFVLVFGIPFEWGMVLGSGIALAYTAMGGLLADALTDTVQFVLMAVTLAIAASISLPMLGGVSQLQQQLPTHFMPTGGRPVEVLLIYIITSLSILIEPAFYQRILAAASQRAVVIAMTAGVLLWMSYDWTTTILGISARAAVAQGLLILPANQEQAVPYLAMHVLPIGLKGLFAAGMVAAAMASIDSYLLISSSNLVYDIWRPLFGKDMSDQALVRWTRITLVVATAANIGICFYFKNVERLWIFITAILICTSLIPVLAAFYWPGVKRRAGLAAAVAGFVLVLAYYAWVDLMGEWVEEEGTFIWNGALLSAPIRLNQDYGLLYILPVVILAFLLAQFLPGGRSR